MAWLVEVGLVRSQLSLALVLGSSYFVSGRSAPKSSTPLPFCI